MTTSHVLINEQNGEPLTTFGGRSCDATALMIVVIQLIKTGTLDILAVKKGENGDDNTASAGRPDYNIGLQQMNLVVSNHRVMN